MRIVLALILAPAAVLVMWFVMPIFKTMMVSIVESWGVAIGLSGFALVLAQSMPLIVPVACVSAIIAGFIFAARSSGVR